MDTKPTSRPQTKSQPPAAGAVALPAAAAAEGSVHRQVRLGRRGAAGDPGEAGGGVGPGQGAHRVVQVKGEGGGGGIEEEKGWRRGAIRGGCISAGQTNEQTPKKNADIPKRKSIIRSTRGNEDENTRKNRGYGPLWASSFHFLLSFFVILTHRSGNHLYAHKPL